MAFREVILCEKETQAKLFVKILKLNNAKKFDGKNTVFYDTLDGIAVVHQSGHILEAQPPQYYEKALSQGWSLSLLPIIPKDNEWALKVKNTRFTKRLFSGISWALKGNGIPREISVAVDNDKEGELLGWEVLVYLGVLGKTKISRLIYSELTLKAVKKAYENKLDGAAFYNRYLAGLARFRADWLIGMNITCGLTVINKEKIPPFKPLNSGRVIFAISYILALREREIQNFVPLTYYNEVVDFNFNNVNFSGRIQYPEKYLDDQTAKMIDLNMAERIHKFILGEKKGTVLSFETKDKKQKPPLGFNRNDLTRRIAKKYGMSLKDFDVALQSIYAEKGLATYPRVGVRHLDISMHEQMPHYIQAMMSNLLSCDKLTSQDKDKYKKVFALCDEKRQSNIWKKGIGDSESHHAIIPTSEKRNLNLLTDNEFIIYKELCDRLIIQFMPEYEYATTVVNIGIGNKNSIISVTKGSVPLSLGFKFLQADDTDDAETDEGDNTGDIPMMSVGDKVNILSSSLIDQQTVKPKRYTEPDLLAIMESPKKFIHDKSIVKRIAKFTIGTDATRDGHVAELKPKGFVTHEKTGKSKKALPLIVPTPKLLAVDEIAPGYLKYPEVSSFWEEEFEKIETGKSQFSSFMNKQEKILIRFFNDAKNGAFRLNHPVEENAKKCTNSSCDGYLYLGVTKTKKIKLWSCSKCKKTYFDKDGELGGELKKQDPNKPKEPKKMTGKHLPCTKCQGKAYFKPLPNKSFDLWECSSCHMAFFDKNGELGQALVKK